MRDAQSPETGPEKTSLKTGVGGVPCVFRVFQAFSGFLSHPHEFCLLDKAILSPFRRKFHPGSALHMATESHTRSTRQFAQTGFSCTMCGNDYDGRCVSYTEPTRKAHP